MPSRREIRDELGDIWKSSKLANADPPPDPPPTPPHKLSRTTRIILKTTLVNAIAVLIIVAIGIYSAYSFFNPLKTESFNLLDKYRIYDPLPDNNSLLALSEIQEMDLPYGRIISPRAGETSPRNIKFTGMTAHIPEDHYVVLAVDVEKQRVCFPKWPIIERNTTFRTEIYDGGPEGECTVSLYAVDEEYYQKILEWLKQERFGGMGLIPLRYRLDFARLIVKSKMA